MYFTDGSPRAFESLMQNRPGTDHYDSGEDGPNEECRTCRFFRPGSSDRHCKYPRCPYVPEKMTAMSEGNTLGKGGDVLK